MQVLDPNVPLDALVDAYLEIVASPRNQFNRAKWDHTYPWDRDNWRALPLGASFVVDPDRPFLSKLLCFDMARYLTEPEQQLRHWLRMNILRYQELDDDTYFGPSFTPWWSVVTEAGIMGMPVL